MIITDRLRASLAASTDLALRRAAELQERVDSWSQEADLDLVEDVGDDSTGFQVRGLPAVPLELSLLFSEAVHGMALTFDHIAWALVSEETRADRRSARRVQMPVVLRGDSWQGRLGDALRGMPGDYEPAVRAIQPFALVPRAAPREDYPEPRAADFALAIMRGLDNAAKHQAHHAGEVMLLEPMQAFRVMPHPPDGYRVTRYERGGLAVGREVFRAYLPPTYTVTLASPNLGVVFRPSATLDADDERFRSMGIPSWEANRLVTDLAELLTSLVASIDAIDQN